MNRHEQAEKSFKEIHSLIGMDELKLKVEHLRRFKENSDKHAITDVTLPNYLWVAKRGGGVTTSVSVLAEYLFHEKIIDFTGDVKFLEFKLSYNPNDEMFYELTRLNNTISEIAGHHRYFRGILCLNIDEWVSHTKDPNFYKLLDFISNKNDKILAILYVHNQDKKVIENLESDLSAHIRFESLWLRFPNTDELLELIDTKYFKRDGFYLSSDAKNILRESIEEIVKGKNFNGFHTIRQLASDIIYGLLTADMKDFEISAEELSTFNKDSAYVKRIKAFVGNTKMMGFSTTTEEN